VVLMEWQLGPVTVDLSALTFMDSSGLAVFDRALKRAARFGTTLTVRGVQPSQRRLFDIVGLTGPLKIEGD
jgi:anti-anti-sigma factor